MADSVLLTEWGTLVFIIKYMQMAAGGIIGKWYTMYLHSHKHVWMGYPERKVIC